MKSKVNITTPSLYKARTRRDDAGDKRSFFFLLLNEEDDEEIKSEVERINGIHFREEMSMGEYLCYLFSSKHFPEVSFLLQKYTGDDDIKEFSELEKIERKIRGGSDGE